jgi:predicted AAA+ superfamily ATPase
MAMHQDALRALLEASNPWWSGRKAPVVASYPRRDLHARLLDHLGSRGGRRAVLIVGPRQVGKTVLLFQLAYDLLDHDWPHANLTYFDFSDPLLTEEISPQRVVDLTPVAVSRDRPRVFLLDEISRAAKWDQWLKQAVDRGQHRFIATDSAASLLRRKGRESGQGRWDEFQLEGLVFPEFLRLIAAPGESQQDTLVRVPNAVERYLAAGGFPEHTRSDDYYQVRERIRADIADRAIRRDLLRLDVDVERLRELFVYLIQDSGSIFNAATRARDLGADPRSAANWMALLEDTRLIVPLQRHVKRAAARLRSQPRVYAADHGLIAAFTPGGSLDRGQRTRGQALEAVVYRHLRELMLKVRGELSFFRRDDKLEADFVMEAGDRISVLEVTSSTDPRSDKFKKLVEVGDVLKTKNLALIHEGAIDEPSNRPIISMALARFLLEPSLLLEAQK